MKLVCTVAGVAVIALVAASCSAVPDSVDGVAPASNGGDTSGLPASLGSLSQLAALPSAAPDSGYASGGGGFVGEPWTVWGLPGSRGGSDPGISPDKLPVAGVLGLRPTFTAQTGGQSYHFVVQDSAGKNSLWDSNSDPDACSFTSDFAGCTLPADQVGLLRNGSVYRLLTTVVDTSGSSVTTPRLFQVTVGNGISGSTGANVLGRKFTSSLASMQLGLVYSSADQGPQAGQAATSGARWGLPAGWSWSGVPGGFMSADLESNSVQYAGYTSLLTLSTTGSSSTLGCQGTTGVFSSVCSPIGSSNVGAGLSAVIKSSDGSIVATNQSTGQNWTFTVATGGSGYELTGYASVGNAPVALSYRSIMVDSKPQLVLDTVSIPMVGWTWHLLYADGSNACADADSGLSQGLVATPQGSSCGWVEPSGDRSVIFYSQPSGATVPRVSRVVKVPAACPSWSACDASQLGVFELGWDSQNRAVLQRQDATVQAALLGNIDPSDTSFMAQTSYDDLNRISAIQQPERKGADQGADGTAVGGSTDTYTYESADPKFAPATRELVKTSTVDGGPSLTSIAAFDGIGRRQFMQDPDGVLSSWVWDPDKALVYGTTQGNDAQGVWSVAGTSYDEFGRAIKSSSGVPASFDMSSCAPDAPGRSSSACAPASGAGDQALTTKSYTYDESLGTGHGLKAQWYSSDDLSGYPVATQKSVQQSSNGFTISAPKGAGNQWSVALSGGIVLNSASTWNVTVDVPPSMFSGGSVFIGGNVCAVITPGESEVSCTFTSDGSTYPFALNLICSGKGKGSGQVSVSLQANEFEPPVTSNSSFNPVWGVNTTTRSVDHDNTGVATTYTTQNAYTSLYTSDATSVTSLPASTGDQSGQVLSAPAQGLTRTQGYEPTQVGTATPVSVTSPGGNTQNSVAWGMNDTPAGLPNADQLPASVRNVAQHGLTKTLTEPNGHVDWTVYDQYGRSACQASTSSAKVTPAWSCAQTDGAGRLTSSVARGQDGQPDISLSYVYRYDSDQSHSPFISVITRTQGDAVTQDQTREWPGALTDTYTDASGTVTAYTYNSTGSVDSVRTHVANATDGADFSVTYQYDDLARPTTVSTDTRTLATVSYQPDNPRQIASVSYLGGQVISIPGYTDLGQQNSATWSLPDGTVTDTVTASAQGWLSKETFGDLSGSYIYDPYGRLAQASIESGGTEHDFSYGFDSDANRTCAAPDIANPTHQSCDQLAGHTSYTYVKDQLVASSSPSQAIPANPLNNDGTYRQIGNQAYSYDATRQLQSTTNNIQLQTKNPAGAHPASGKASSGQAPSGQAEQTPAATAQTITFVRDAYNRVIAQTTTPASTGMASTVTPPASSASPTHSEAATLTATSTATPAPTSSPTSSPEPVVPAPDTTGAILRYVYPSASSQSPSAFVFNGHVTPMISLPGGLLMTGSTPTIQSVTGLANLQLNPDGSKGSNTITGWGPYGEPLTAAANPVEPQPGWHSTTAMFDSTLISLGARAYRTDLAMFTQPDPIPTGSGTLNSYNYVFGDPVNTTDLTGTSWIIPAIAAGLSAFMSMAMVGVASDALASLFMPRFGFAAGTVLTGLGTAAATFGISLALQAGVNAGLGISAFSNKSTYLAAAAGGLLAGVFAGISVARAGAQYLPAPNPRIGAAYADEVGAGVREPIGMSAWEANRMWKSGAFAENDPLDGVAGLFDSTVAERAAAEALPDRPTELAPGTDAPDLVDKLPGGKVSIRVNPSDITDVPADEKPLKYHWTGRQFYYDEQSYREAAAAEAFARDGFGAW